MGSLWGVFVRSVLSAVSLSLVLSVAGSMAVPGLTANAVAGVQDVSSDKVLVQYLAHRDPRSTVRIGAWQALLSSAPDQAVAQFLASGYDYAVKLAAESKARNADFAKRVLDTYPAEFAPEVHAAAQFAVNSRNDADRERFAHGGFAAAQQRDSHVRDTQGQQAKALVEADRQYVRNLAANDPGTQVRVSASYAVRVGATDSDLVDFFATDWAFGARLDLESYRLQGADNDTRWRADIARLLVDAQAAEKAAREASGDLAEKARATAVLAWQTVGEHTGPARSAWADARDGAARQAANWAAIAEAASAATGPNWSAVVAPALSNKSDWAAEQDFATQQSQYWNSLLRQAIDGEQRVRTGS